MRAKTINEVTKFERGMTPKGAMGIGGVQFGVERTNMKKRQNQEWIDFVTNLLLEKTVTGTMNKMYWIDDGTGINQPKLEYEGWNTYTVKVKQLKVNPMNDVANIILFDEEKKGYQLEVSEEKYYIK